MLRVDNGSDVERIKKKGKRNGDNYDESEYGDGRKYLNDKRIMKKKNEERQRDNCH